MLKYSFQILMIVLPLTLYPANAKGADTVIQCPYLSESIFYDADNSPDRVSSWASKIYNIIVNDDTIGFANMLYGVDNLRPEYVKKVGINKIFSSKVLDAIKEKFLTCHYNEPRGWRWFPHILRIPYGLHYTLSRNSYGSVNDTLSIMFNSNGIISINDSGNGYTPELPLPIPANGAWKTSKGVVHPVCLWDRFPNGDGIAFFLVDQYNIVAQYNIIRDNWPKIPEDTDFRQEPGYFLGVLNSQDAKSFLKEDKSYIESYVRIADERCFPDYWEYRIADADAENWYKLDMENLTESKYKGTSSYTKGTNAWINYNWDLPGNSVYTKGTNDWINYNWDGQGDSVYSGYRVAYKPSLEACTHFEPYIGGQCKDGVVLHRKVYKRGRYWGTLGESWDEYVLYGLFLIKDKEYIIPLRGLGDVNGLRSFIESLEK